MLHHIRWIKDPMFKIHITEENVGECVYNLEIENNLNKT